MTNVAGELTSENSDVLVSKTINGIRAFLVITKDRQTAALCLQMKEPSEIGIKPSDLALILADVGQTYTEAALKAIAEVEAENARKESAH